MTVLDAEGRRIPRPEGSHFNDDAMPDLMRHVVDRLFALHDLRVSERCAKADHLARRHGLGQQPTSRTTRHRADSRGCLGST